MAGLRIGGGARRPARPKTGGRCSKVPARSRLPFPEAARRAGIRADRQRYFDALRDLEYEGAIGWDESARYARGDKHYVLTRRGQGGAG